jgi:prepilin-type processing-associated H-X9-DG protein
MYFADQKGRGGNAYDYHCWTFSSLSSISYENWSRASERHAGFCEVGFVDGHVASEKVTTVKAPASLCY